jgi:DNA-binding winged helix-turn-helix (wHTH) protein
MEQCFIINGRFLVDTTTNILTDRENGSTNRLEARLVQVLCILTEAAGRTVLREQLVEKVWQNYGGGDEGLTQAISALRKAFKDQDKMIIQTVPKKGYLYTGTTTAMLQVTSRPKTNKKNIAVTVGIAAVFMLFFLIIPTLLNTFKQTASTPQKVANNQLSIIADEKPEAYGLNSVTCYDSNHNSYKWISNGDAQPEFYINNVRVPIGEWESHMTVITYLKHKLQEKSIEDKIKQNKRALGSL